MGCNCRVTESILAIVILVFALWQVTYSTWIVSIAAVLLLVHSMWCKNCGECEMPAKKRRR